MTARSAWRRVRLDRVLASRILLAVGIYLYFYSTEFHFGTPNNTFTIFEGFATLGLAALAIGITIIAGELDLSVGSVAVVSGILAVMWADLGLVASVLLATACAALFGALQGYAIHRLKIASIVLTLGTLIGLRGLAFVISGENTVVVPDFGIAKVVKYQLFVFSPFSLVTIVAFLVVGAFLAYSRYGREIYAIGGARAEAIAAGVPVRRPLVIVFTLSASLAGLAGALTSLKSGSAAPSGFDGLLLPAATAALIGGVAISGGKGNAFGIALGALTIRFLISGLSLRAEPFYVQTFAVGLLLIAVILLELLVDRPDAWIWLGERRRRRTKGRRHADQAA